MAHFEKFPSTVFIYSKIKFRKDVKGDLGKLSIELKYGDNLLAFLKEVLQKRKHHQTHWQ